MRDLKQNLELELHLIFPFVLELNPRERRVGVNFKDSKSGFRFDFFALTEFLLRTMKQFIVYLINGGRNYRGCTYNISSQTIVFFIYI